MSFIRPYFAPKHSYEAPTTIVIPQAQIDGFCVEKKKREANGEAIERIAKQMKRYLKDLPFSQNSNFIASEWPKLIHAIKMLHYAKQRNTMLLWPKASVDDQLVAKMKMLQIQDVSQGDQSQEPEDSLEKLEKDIREGIMKITDSQLLEAGLDHSLYTQRFAKLQSHTSNPATVAEITCALAVFKEMQEGFQAIGEAQKALLTYLDNPRPDRVARNDPLRQLDLHKAIEEYSALNEDRAKGRFTQKLIKITKHLFETVIGKQGPITVQLTVEEKAVWPDLLAKKDIDLKLLISYAEKKALYCLYFTKEPCDPFLEIVLVTTGVKSDIITSYKKNTSHFLNCDQNLLGRFKDLFALFPKIAVQEGLTNALQVYDVCCQTMAALAKVGNPTYQHKKLLEHAEALLLKATQDLPPY